MQTLPHTPVSEDDDKPEVAGAFGRRRPIALSDQLSTEALQHLPLGIEKGSREYHRAEDMLQAIGLNPQEVFFCNPTNPDFVMLRFDMDGDRRERLHLHGYSSTPVRAPYRGTALEQVGEQILSMYATVQDREMEKTS